MVPLNAVFTVLRLVSFMQKLFSKQVFANMLNFHTCDSYSEMLAPNQSILLYWDSTYVLHERCQMLLRPNVQLETCS